MSQQEQLEVQNAYERGAREIRDLTEQYRTAATPVDAAQLNREELTAIHELIEEELPSISVAKWSAGADGPRTAEAVAVYQAHRERLMVRTGQNVSVSNTNSLKDRIDAAVTARREWKTTSAAKPAQEQTPTTDRKRASSAR